MIEKNNLSESLSQSESNPRPVVMFNHHVYSHSAALMRHFLNIFLHVLLIFISNIAILIRFYTNKIEFVQFVQAI